MTLSIPIQQPRYERHSRHEKVNENKWKHRLAALAGLGIVGAVAYTQRERIGQFIQAHNPFDQGPRTVDYSQRGDERPHVDDPNITGTGDTGNTTAPLPGATVEVIDTSESIHTNSNFLAGFPESTAVMADALGQAASQFAEMLSAGRNMVYVYVDQAGNSAFIFADANGQFPANLPPGGSTYQVGQNQYGNYQFNQLGG